MPPLTRENVALGHVRRGSATACFYRQRAGPPRTSPDEGGPESQSLLPSYDLVEVGAGAGQSFGHRVDVHSRRERTCGARKLGFAS